MRSISDLFRLDGRVALITGGAGHIGLACGEALAECGAKIVVADRDLAACEERAALLTAHGHIEAMGLAVDLEDPPATDQLIDQILARFGRLDVLINNAAYTGTSNLSGYAVPFERQSLEAWNAALRVNLSAPFQLVQRAQHALAKEGHGSVINIASIYGVVGPKLSLYDGMEMGNPAAYNASKGGLIQLTRYLATVMAPHIRVNCISPGGLLRGQPTPFQERYVRDTPLGRMGVEQDLKGAFAFLASNASAYITGQNLCIDGGWTVW